MKVVCLVNNYQFGMVQFAKLYKQYGYHDELVDRNHHVCFLDLPEERASFLKRILKADVNNNFFKVSGFSNFYWVQYFKQQLEKRTTDSKIEDVIHDYELNQLKRILRLDWDSSEENTQTSNKVNNLTNFGWNLVRFISSAVKQLNEEVKNNIEYNKTAKQFYANGLGLIELRPVDEIKEFADDLYRLNIALINELKEINANEKKYKPSFREFLLDCYEELHDSVSVHDAIRKTLNPKLWNEDGTLKPEIKEHIELIVEKYKEWLADADIDITISDVIVIGSNASYNYTSKSDFDVHIIVDESDENMMKIYDAYKSMFNDAYDIKFNNINVEVYVQNDTSDLFSKGIYSIYTGWIKEPSKEEIIQIDVSKEVNELVKEYNSIVNKPSLEGINKLIDKIYSFRRSGLDTEGEYSKENQIFKEFRHKGYLDKLKTLKLIVESEEMLFKDSLTDEVITKMTEEEIKKYRNYGNPKIFFACSKHDDSADDHISKQGKIYVDAKWKSAYNPTKEKKKIEAIEKYIKEHNIQTVQDIIGEPTFLSTRPYCRHVFKSLTADDVLSGNYSLPQSIHNSKRRKKDSIMKNKQSIENLVKDAQFSGKFPHLEALLTKLNEKSIIDGEEYDSLFDFQYRIDKDMLEIFDANEEYTINYEDDMNYEIQSVAEELGIEPKYHEDHIFEDIAKALKQDGFTEILEWENNVVMSILLPKKYLKDTSKYIKVNEELKDFAKELEKHLRSLNDDFSENVYFVNNKVDGEDYLSIDVDMMDWKEHIWLDNEIEKFFNKKGLDVEIIVETHPEDEGSDTFGAEHIIKVFREEK